MKTLNKAFLLILLFLFITSCDDILEEDISDDNIQIIYPREGTVNDGNTVQFSWKHLTGADDYRIQIINENQVVVLDSLVSSNVFNYVIDPGNYDWHVRGENFAYSTLYSFPVNFTVQTSDDLSKQNVILSTPSINHYTNNTDFIFTWEGISSAATYTYELIKNLNGEQTLIQQPGILVTSFSANSSTFDEDAEYIWRVKAINATSETIYSQRSLFIDRISPNQPSLTSPVDQIVTANTVVFNWTNGTDSGNVKSSISNTLQISTDIDFNTLVHTSNTSNNTYQYVFNDAGTYYWRVKAVDASTNESDFSIVRSVVVE